MWQGCQVDLKGQISHRLPFALVLELVEVTSKKIDLCGFDDDRDSYILALVSDVVQLSISQSSRHDIVLFREPRSDSLAVFSPRHRSSRY